MPETAQDRLFIAKEIVKLFLWERFTYLIISSLAAIIVIFVGIQAYKKGGSTTSDLTLLAGSGGVIAVSVSRLLQMFNKVFEAVLKAEPNVAGGIDAGIK